MIKPNTITDQVGHVVDIAPTFLDLLGVSYPDSVAGYPSLPLDGRSLLPIFKGEERTEPAFFISGLEKFRMFRQHQYKIVRMNEGDWELYNMDNDPTELHNLALDHPEKVKELDSLYQLVTPK